MKNDDLPVIVVGGGPAGMMAGLLLARAGVAVTVLEKHDDFLRDFRGDTVHPSTLELIHQLGWLDEFLQCPHSRINLTGVHIAGQDMQVADFRHLPVAAPFIAMMPQWDVLNFLAEKARAYPTFNLCMGAEAVGVMADDAAEENGRICGVELASGETLPARLVIAADGRRSILRGSAGLPLETLGAPMDVFWFRLDKPAGLAQAESFGSIAAGKFMVLIDRQDYYQCAYVLRKGDAQRIRERGLARFRADLKALSPALSSAIDTLQSWDEVKLLDVALDRLTRWHCPGLLAIGDAAHAMSPIAGVGINVAIQDAVAAANILAQPLSDGHDPDPFLPKVQQKRWAAVKRMQTIQKIAQDRALESLLARTKRIERPFLPLRLLNRFPLLRRIPGRIIGLGFGRQNIESADVFAD